MKKVYYQYDPQARVYRRVFPTFGQRLKAWFIRLLSAALLGGVFFIIYLFAVSTPKAGDLVTENSRLQSQYRVLSRKVDDALLVLHDIEERDNNLYRVLLEADPVPESARQSGFNGTSRYAELLDMTNAELVVNTSQKVDMLKRNCTCRPVPSMKFWNCHVNRKTSWPAYLPSSRFQTRI